MDDKTHMFFTYMQTQDILMNLNCLPEEARTASDCYRCVYREQQSTQQLHHLVLAIFVVCACAYRTDSYMSRAV